MTTAWFDCSSGASGDMLLGALVDAGAPLATVQAAVDSLDVERMVLRAEPVTRAGLAALRIHVDAPASDQERSWGDVRQLLEAAALAEPVRSHALAAFERLARAEATAHGSTPEEVRFHEVGALDAIADVVGCAAALHALGVTESTASAVALGSGAVRSGHGLLPVPAPGVLGILAAAGAAVHAGDAPYELCTPTGAALLAATVIGWGPLPPMRLRAVGTGAGAREHRERPNVLRVLLGEAAAVGAQPPATEALLLAANVDDLDPRLWPAVLTRLLDAGAADAWLVPILMKKGRPAHTLSVLVDPQHADAVRRVVFTETSTIGLREHPVDKRALDRSEATVTVGGCAIRVKSARLEGAVVNATLEFDDLAAAARTLGRPVKAILAEALAAVHDAGLLR